MENAENPLKSRLILNLIQNEKLQKSSNVRKKCSKWILRRWLP